jgi:N utilization substance protein A
MLGQNLKREIDQIAKDKGIDAGEIISAIEEAMTQAAHKRHGAEKEIEARFNEELGEIEIFEFRTVVEEIANRESEILIDKARAEFDAEAEVGDEIGIKMDTADFGRILAQTAKQVIIQRIRDAERDNTFDEYSDRKGEIVNGIVRRFEKGSLIIDLGRAEAVLPPKEQVPRENYRPGDRVRAYVIDVSKATKGPQIMLSRACTEMITKLFEQEVPEMYEKIVTIEAAAREPGGRSKIAVSSRDSDVDPVGACVGMKGSRVQNVVQELQGERIDIVPWSPDPAKYVSNALAPAQVSMVVVDEENKTLLVIVPDDQQSLAIGRGGQNVRLASMLLGWNIDVKSEQKYAKLMEDGYKSLTEVEGVDDAMADILYDNGITSAQELSEAVSEDLVELKGIDEEMAPSLVEAAKQFCVAKETEEPADDAAVDEEESVAEETVVEDAAAEEKPIAEETVTEEDAGDAADK